MMRHGLRSTLLLIAVLSATAALPQDEATPDAIAYLQVRTLVIDALGTRTVDVAHASVPYNNTGLLMRQVLYGGPPLSFRLLVRPGTPSEDGIHLALITEVWGGALADDPNDDEVERREETAVIELGTSVLLELAHERATGSGDGSPGSERRVMLSITVSDKADPAQAGANDPLREVHFLFQMIRQNGNEVDPPETHVLSSLVGRPVSYSSHAVPLGRPSRETPGLTFTLAAEEAEGNLVTVRLRVTGFDYVDAGRSRLAPVTHESLHTVRSGSSFLVEVPVGDGTPGAPSPGEKPPVAWVVNVTPQLA